LPVLKLIMALNVKTLGIRALSALVFVALLLGCLLWNYYSFSIFFFVVSMMGLHEFYKLAEKLNARPYKTIGFLTAAFIYLLFTPLFTGPAVYLSLLAPFVIFSVALFVKRENPVQNALYTLAGLIYAVLPFGLLHHTVLRSGMSVMEFDPSVLLGVILLIWSNDTFAYLGGSLFGRHKMIERISPGKTWEGTVFGILVTIGSGYVIGAYILDQAISFWLTLGIIVPILATVGDLVESMLKREAGVKDTGSIMPGHGGILDRFDSLIFVSPFVFVTIKLLQLY
jgi:phosphatidate cytidylyltransferase